MAPTNNNSPGAKDATPRPSSGLEKTTRETGAEKRKRPTEENAEGPHTGVDVLLGEGGGTRSRAPQLRASHEQAHGPAVANDDDFVVITGTDAGGSRATQKRRATDSPATEGAAANLSPSQVAALLALLQKQAAAPVTTPAATTEAENFASAKTANIRNNVSTSARVAASHRADKGKAPAVEDEPAAPDDSDSDSDSDAGEEPNNPMPLLPNDLLPPLHSPHPSTAAAAFNRKGVRDQAEVFEALQTYLAHVEHKIRGSDVAGALKTVGQAQDLIKRRFDVLVVADHAGFDAQKGRGWAAREQADKKIKHYANRPETIGFFPLAVDTYGCPCAEVPVFLKLLADSAARRHFNADSKSFYAAKFLHQFRQRWSVALQRAQSVGLRMKLGEAAAAENPPVGGIGHELHLGDCFAVVEPLLEI
ncbi:unnamed protein product [Closterium sp. NIES-54]